MADGVVVHRLNTGDLRAYKALRDEMLEGHPEAFTSDAQTEGHRRAEDYLPRLGLERPEGGHLTFGAWEATSLLGAIGLERDMRPKVRHIGHVVGMMVRDDAQSRGIGRMLLDALIEEARDRTRTADAHGDRRQRERTAPLRKHGLRALRHAAQSHPGRRPISRQDPHGEVLVSAPRPSTYVVRPPRGSSKLGAAPRLLMSAAEPFSSRSLPFGAATRGVSGAA